MNQQLTGSARNTAAELLRTCAALAIAILLILGVLPELVHEAG